MKKILLILVTSILLMGCNDKPNYIPTGGAAGTPTGAISYCTRNPEAIECQP